METALDARQKTVMPRTPSTQKALHAAYYALLIVYALFCLLPLWGTLTTSLKTSQAVETTSPLAMPGSPVFVGYRGALEELKTPLLNSLIITAGGALGSVFLGSVCAYALTKFQFRFRGLFYLLLTVAIYLPYQAILIPLFRTINALNLYDTKAGLILLHTVFGMPMCAVMFAGFYAEVPDCVVKQAMIDGSGPWRIYRKVVVPSTKIATMTVLVFQCTSIWNEMLFALIFGAADAMPATIALNNMAGTLAAERNVQMAGSIWLAMPVLALYIILGKYLIRGYMAGSVTAS
ncbi:MAG: carbohydrate ABC transporter permease [Oscillospiraceae bacterium]|jgi:glucose/mannose transport system permease protein|nr:carbohydrate ABC transporter permease [Oscillospiraceae bacterium]